ncbi:hypothetical protein A2U01_0108323, partial [Trifolium medium]|nr:hypothetical protein [Trifolium medium]
NAPRQTTFEDGFGGGIPRNGKKVSQASVPCFES